MMKRRTGISFLSMSTVLLIVSLFVSNASAGLMMGSSGTTYIMSNNPTSPAGTFYVKIAYAVYDGHSALDPLGVTSDMQVAFKLTHVGSWNTEAAKTFGRFTVFAPDQFATNAFYTNALSVGTGLAPNTINIDPPMPLPTDPIINRVQFNYWLGINPLFTSGSVSSTLVVTVAHFSVPATVLLEVDRTSPAGLDGFVSLNLVPEPCSMALFGAGVGLMGVWRRKRLG